MITAITLNPSVDRRYFLDGFETNKVFRAMRYGATAGGKGLNVARVVNLLGEEVLATGLVGGKSGEWIEEELEKIGIPHQFQAISGETRTCLAILSGKGSQTEVLETGPTVEEDELSSFLSLYDSLLVSSTIIVGSGSLMKGMPQTLYSTLIEKAHMRNIPFLLDTSGEALLEGIKAKPFFIKPNLEELEAIVNSNLSTKKEIVQAVRHLTQNNVEVVMVSLGSEGAIVVTKEEAMHISIPRVSVVNPTGSGDSTVAGFATALKRGMSLNEAVRLAVACGTANAMEEMTGFVDVEKVDKVFIETSIHLI